MNLKTVTLLLAVVALGGGIRWAVLERVFPVNLVGDEHYYSLVAESLAREGIAKSDHARALRPPAHAFLLSLLIPAGESRNDVVLHRLLFFAVALGSAVVALTFLLGAALFDVRVGTVAGLIAAADPNLIAFSHSLWSENLYAVVLLSGLLIVVCRRRAPTLWDAAAAGLIFGLGALTREAALLIGAVGGVWWTATAARNGRSRALFKGTLLCVIAAACVLPWTVRNYQVLGRVIPVSTIGWLAGAEGNSIEEPNWMASWGPRRASFKAAYNQIDGELARMDFARQYTLERIAAEQPTWFFKKLVRNVTQLFTPDSPLLYKIRMGGYGPLSPDAVQRLAAATTLPYIVVFLGGTLGIAAARGNGRLLLPCLILGVALFVHVLTHATVRYRMPLMPLFIIYAAQVVVERKRILGSMTRSRWVALAAVWSFFFGVCVPYSVDLRAALF